MSQSRAIAPSNVRMGTENQMFVTMIIDHQRFGISVAHVRDVLKDQRVACIPKAPSDIAGSINLRGRIVTVINMRKRLALTTEYGERPVFVVVDFNGEYFSLMVDRVTEVLTIQGGQIEGCPVNLTSNWREVATGICQLQDDLLVIIDINALLGI